MEDNGIGPAAKGGNGLRGMRERVGTLGGMVELARLVPSGTALTVTLPLAQEASVFDDVQTASQQGRLPTAAWTVPA